MDNTFNQAFNPITNTKSIKEYETEIDTLKNEVFELKTRISQMSSPQHQPISQHGLNQLLVDAKRSIDLLENENIKLKNELVSVRNSRLSKKGEENSRLMEFQRKISEECKLKCDRVNEERDKIAKELEILKNKNQTNNSAERINDLENERKDLLDEIKRKVNEHEEVCNQFNKYIAEQKENHTSEVKFYKNEIQKQTDESIRYQNDVKTKINQLEMELNNALHDNNMKLQEIEHFKQDKNEFQEIYKKMEISNQNCTNLQRLNTELQCHLKSSQLRNDQLEKKLSLMNQELSDVRKGERVFNNDVDQLKEKLQAASLENNNLQNLLNTAVVQKKELTDKISNITKENNEICKRYYLIDQKENIERTNDHKVTYYKEKHQKSVILYNNLFKECKLYLTEYNSLLTRYQNIIKTLEFKISCVYSNLKTSFYTSYTVDKLLNKENLDFIKKNFPHESNINNVLNKMKRIYSKMTEKINVLENDTKQLTLFAEKSARNQNYKTEKLIDNFIAEFKDAKNELEFCKTYIKDKGKAFKDLKIERTKQQEIIEELEYKLKNMTREKEKKSSFFSRLY